MKKNKDFFSSLHPRSRFSIYSDKALSFILYHVWKGFSLFEWYVIPLFGIRDPFHYRIKLLM